MQVQYLGGIGLGADVFGASIILLVGHRDPLCGSELLLQETSVDLLLLQCFDAGTFTQASLLEGLSCCSHNDEEGLLHPLP
jgi:hypothetical protein